MFFRVKQSVQIAVVITAMMGVTIANASVDLGSLPAATSSKNGTPNVAILSAPPSIHHAYLAQQMARTGGINRNIDGPNVGTGLAASADHASHSPAGTNFVATAGPAFGVDANRIAAETIGVQELPGIAPSPVSVSVTAPRTPSINSPGLALLADAPLTPTALADRPKLGGYTSALIGGSVDWGVVSLYSMLGTLALASHNWDTDKKFTAADVGFAYITTPESHETVEYDNQAGLDAVAASHAFARGFTGSGVTVSVVDSPFDTDHPELDDVFLTGYNPRTGTTEVDRCTQSGAIAVDSACNAGFRDHGTHVAGIIGAKKGNGNSTMHGLAYGAKIKPIAFLEGTGSFTYSDVFSAASGGGIIASNNSWGLAPSYYSSLYNGRRFKIPNSISVTSQYQDAVSAGADNGTVFVFAAGNDGWNETTGVVDLYDNMSDTVVGTESATVLANAFSGLSSNMIDSWTALITNMDNTSSLAIDTTNAQYRYLVVASLDPSTNQISTFSNACGVAKAYCLVAPGTSITSTVDGGAYGVANGTSMAAPHVTAAIALLRQNWPNLEPEVIVEILLKSAKDKGATGVDDVYGHGLLDLKAATGPLGELNLAPWPDSLGVPSALGGSNMGMETPAAFGDMLATQEVEASARDSYDRVFAVKVAVTPTTQKAMDVAAMMDSALDPVDAGQQIKISDASSFTVAVDNTDDVQRASVRYVYELPEQTIRAGYIDHRVTADTTAEIANGFDDDYANYFYGMESDALITKSVHFTSDVTMPAVTGGTKRVATRMRYGRTASGDERVQSASTFGMARGGYNLDATIGALRESNGILGGRPTGALALAGATSTIFGRIDAGVDLSPQTRLSGYYTRGQTKVRFLNANLATLEGLATDSYGVKLRRQLGEGADAVAGPALILSAWRPTAVTAGTFTINTIAGYNSDGSLRRGQFRYGLSPKRETAFQADLVQASHADSKLAVSVFHRINAGNIDGAEDTGAFIVSRQSL